VELVDPKTGRAFLLDKLRGRLAGWLRDERVLETIFVQRLLTPGDVGMMRAHPDQISLRGMARIIERVFDNRYVRRSLIVYEMKVHRTPRRAAKSEVDGYLAWAREIVRPSKSGLITFN